MRNDLLAGIVTASGGTITDRNNRNLLLKDWLEAVQAPAVNYVARLNGDDQYWQLSEDINLQDSDVVNFKFVGGVVSGTFRRFIGSNNFSFGLSSGSTGFVFNEVNMSASLDGVSIESESTQIPSSGSHDISCVIVGAHTLSQLCAADSSRFMNLPLYEFEVIRNGAVVHSIPLTNKSQGATQLATVGSVNATMVGYTPDVWEVLPEPEPINYVARLNGTDQSWELSTPLNLVVGDVVNLKALGVSQFNGAAARFIGGDGFAFSLDTGNDGDVFRETRLSALLNGVEIDSLVTPLPSSGEFSLSVTLTASGVLSYIGATDGGARSINTAVYEFEVIRNGVIIHQIPLNNKAQGATQLATVGSVNATMIGYNSDVWEQV
jgi:hypothetical protein